jgi:HIRAN domain-containing protein
MDVDVEFQERYWYPDDGGEVWVAGYYPVDASGRFLARDALGPDLIVTHVAGATHRPDALASEDAAPGRPLTLRPEPDNPHDPNAVAVLLASGEPVGYVPRDVAPRVDAAWSAVVLREFRPTPRDPRTGLTMLLARAAALALRGR